MSTRECFPGGRGDEATRDVAALLAGITFPAIEPFGSDSPALAGLPGHVRFPVVEPLTRLVVARCVYDASITKRSDAQHAAEIERLLHRLDDVLSQHGHEAALYLVGGANMALAVDSRRSTMDVDAVVKQGFDVVFDAAAEVAKSEPGLSPDWLNSEFTGGTPDGGLAWLFFDNKDEDAPSTLFAGKSLTVELASPEMMLALKTLAQRDRDIDDIYELMRMTDIRTPRGLAQNLVRFTGPRIIQEQNKPWMPHHIDPSFRFILDNAPEDLRPAPEPK